MDKETIMDLYYGKVNPQDMGMIEAAEYENHCRQFLQGAQQFSEKLSPELREEFQNLCGQEMGADEILHRDGFCKGFQVGLKLALEALQI